MPPFSFGGSGRPTVTLWLVSSSSRVPSSAVTAPIARLESAVAIFRWMLLRDLTGLMRDEPLGTRGSLHKLLWTYTDQHLHDLGSRMGGLPRLTGDSHWLRHFYWTRAESIFAGSSEIQKNLIAERILGLPR